MDYAKIGQELIRGLRGHRSQVQLARRLGYRSNPVAEWEGGRRSPSGTDFVAVCRVAGADLDGVLGVPDEAASSMSDRARLLRALRYLAGNQTPTRLASSVGRSRSAVSRWLSGQTQPRLPELLAFIEGATGKLPDIVAALVCIDEMPSVRSAWTRAGRARRLLFDQPWTMAVLGMAQALEDCATPITEPRIAGRLRIDEDVVRHAIEGLTDAGLLAQTPSGLQLTHAALTVDTDAVPGGPDALKRHWADVAKGRLATRSDDDQFGYAVFGVSREDLGRIRDAFRDFYATVRRIAAPSRPTETVALLNVNLIDLAPP